VVFLSECSYERKITPTRPSREKEHAPRTPFVKSNDRSARLRRVPVSEWDRKVPILESDEEGPRNNGMASKYLDGRHRTLLLSHAIRGFQTKRLMTAPVEAGMTLTECRYTSLASRDKDVI